MTVISISNLTVKIKHYLEPLENGDSRLITDRVQQNFSSKGESSFPWQGSFSDKPVGGGQIQ